MRLFFAGKSSLARTETRYGPSCNHGIFRIASIMRLTDVDKERING
jgi:hypothetical protein